MALQNDRRFMALCKKHGISVERGVELFREKFQDGGTKLFTPDYSESEAYTKGLPRLQRMERELEELLGYTPVKRQVNGQQVPDIGAMQNFLANNYPDLVDDYMSRITPTNLKRENPDAPFGGFTDNRWWYRFPEIQRKVFSSQEEYDEWVENRRAVGNVNGTSIFSDNSDVFFIPEVQGSQTIDANGEILTADVQFQEPTRPFRPIPARVNSGMPFLGNPFITPPSRLQPHLLANNRFDRLSPFEVSNEPFIQASADNLNFVTEQLTSRPFAQNQAVLANFIANSERNLFNQLSQNQIRNVAERQRVDAANANIQAREDLANTQNALDFERRQLTAQAKTDADINNYFETLRRQEMGTVNFLNKYNTIQSLYPNIFNDGFGNLSGGSPSSLFVI